MTPRVIPGPAGHWYTVVQGELVALPVSTIGGDPTAPPPHPEAEGGSLDGWYHPEDLPDVTKGVLATVCDPPPDGETVVGDTGNVGYITGTGQILGAIHDRSACEGRNCTIHNPSDHSMRKFRTHWREDRGLMERICPHGVGHPDPDHMAFVRETQGDERADAEWVHGCDGCCRPKDTTAGEEAALQVLNDRWGVASWKRDDHGTMVVTLDDGDTCTVQANGEWEVD